MTRPHRVVSEASAAVAVVAKNLADGPDLMWLRVCVMSVVFQHSSHELFTRVQTNLLLIAMQCQ